MGKLFNLKKWLMVADAARHLAIVFGEEVTEADVLRLALDGQLRLSVYFVNYAEARCGQVVGYEEAEWGEFSAKLMATLPNISDEAKGKPMRYMKSLNIDDKRFLNLSEEVTTLQGVWDLPMIGEERLDVEHEYQNLTGGPAVTLSGLDGAFVEGPDGRLCQLQESDDNNEYQPGSIAQLEELKQHIANKNIGAAEAKDLLNRHNEKRKTFLEKSKSRPKTENYYPAGGLPKDSVLVVRTEALRAFEESINDAPPASTNRNNVSDKLAKLNQASTKFWANADRDDRATHPNNAKVVEWLVEQQFSETLAEKAATIIRPDWAPTGRKPEE